VSLHKLHEASKWVTAELILLFENCLQEMTMLFTIFCCFWQCCHSFCFDSVVIPMFNFLTFYNPIHDFTPHLCVQTRLTHLWHAFYIWVPTIVDFWLKNTINARSIIKIHQKKCCQLMHLTFWPCRMPFIPFIGFVAVWTAKWGSKMPICHFVMANATVATANAS